MRDSPPVGFKLSLIHRAMKKYIDEGIKAEGLTGVQLFALGQLRRLEESGAEVNQKDLERVCRVTHPTMTDIIKRLERKGFVRCQQSSADRRYKCIYSTDAARGMDGRLRVAEETALSELCRGLSREQTELFAQITDIMAANAGKILEKGCDCDGNYKDPCRLP